MDLRVLTNLAVLLVSGYDHPMKISDDYHAKVRLWAQRPTVVPLPAAPPLPKFTAQKFRTHEELNQWKHTLFLEVARTVARRG